MSLNIILFGRLADLAADSIVVEEVADTDNLVKALHTNYPALAETKYAIAVDRQIISENTTLNKNSVIALLPPFSGG